MPSLYQTLGFQKSLCFNPRTFLLNRGHPGLLQEKGLNSLLKPELLETNMHPSHSEQGPSEFRGENIFV